ncbi:hydroxyethylthiazole kinase [Segnochrobactrum spirostomi]|uniref:Hydroxyethylthiazole kinase n=1 Tax=Segnochrobactrum spirostomi TaxID=2608987 RepID=A0A6A7Y9E3_9HYPH|nr:hydroxyethylthiazole kinase [Segnochrobactrum spirostomi]MQT14628.1 hydroxyethylthiazole kinase [Segnochrobactrum spirostomi]
MLRSASHAPKIDDVVAAHAALRARRPLVQCLTNTVSTNFMANVLLAAGAAPAMVDNPEEAALFAGIADGVLVNLGTPTAAQVASMRLAAEAAEQAGKPWVLDPIGAGGLPWRGGIAAELLRFHPTIIRGNASEVIGLAGLGGGARGVDSSADPSAAVGPAVDLLAHAATVSASGPVDHVVGEIDGLGVALVRIAGGSPLLPRVTATGCALGALAAAYAAVAPDPLTGLVAAHVHYSVAAEIAEEAASGPGSFAAAFLDALDGVDEAALRDRARIEDAIPVPR